MQAKPNFYRALQTSAVSGIGQDCIQATTHVLQDAMLNHSTIANRDGVCQGFTQRGLCHAAASNFMSSAVMMYYE